MSPELISSIQTALQMAIVAILGALALFVKSYLEMKSLKNQAEKIKLEQEIRQAQVEFGLKRLDHIVTSVVGEAEQKKPRGDKPTARENADRFDAVKTEITAQVQPEIMQAVSTIVRNPDRYVDTKIEAAVGEIKRAS